MGLISAFKSWREVRNDGIDPASGLVPLGLSDALKTVSNFQQPGGYAGWNDLRGFTSTLLPDTAIDYAARVGDLRLSTLVMAAVRYIGDAINDARFNVVRLDADDKETKVDHPLTGIMKRPNAYYSSRSLWRGFAFSWIAAGECYFIKAKDRQYNSKLEELWYEPHWTIKPQWERNSPNFIDYFEYYRNGQWLRLETEDVFALYDGIDPETRRGFSATGSMLREYFTDQQAGRFVSQLLANGLVPPVIISVGDKDRAFTGDIEALKNTIFRKMRGDQAGEPLVISDAVNAEKLGFEYDKVGMKEVRETPEERFCAVTGISAHSLLLGSGRTTSTYSNVEQYLKNDYRRCIIPLQNYIAEEADVKLLPDLGKTDGLACRWDYSNVALMQADKMADAKRSAILWTTQGIDRAEYREANGYKMRDDDEGVYYEGKAQGVPSTGIGSADSGQPDSTQPMKSKLPIADLALVDSADIIAARDWLKRRANGKGDAILAAFDARAN